MKEKHMETIHTYDNEVAEKAIKEWGHSARLFQKSISDGKGSLFTIIKNNGKVVDVMEDFDPIF